MMIRAARASNGKEAMEAMVCSLGPTTPSSAPVCAVLARVGWAHGVATATFLL